MNKLVTVTFARTISLIGLFSLLAFGGVCPAWFLGLLIAIHLLRFSGWLALHLHDNNSDVTALLGPAAISRMNEKAQITWGSLLLVHLVASSWFLTVPTLNGTLLDFAYCALGCLQLGACYETFSRVRPLLLVPVDASALQR